MKKRHLGAALIKRKDLKNERGTQTTKQSLTYQNNYESFVESLELKKNACSLFEEKEILDKKMEIFRGKVQEIVESYDITKNLPPRIKDSHKIYKYKSIYHMIETTVFNMWKSHFLSDFIFEHNLEIWRQFFVSVERAETLIQVIDIRNLDLFLNREIISSFPMKKHIILLNKCDILGFGVGKYYRKMPKIDFSHIIQSNRSSSDTNYSSGCLKPSFKGENQQPSDIVTLINTTDHIYSILDQICNDNVDVFFINEKISFLETLKKSYGAGTYAFIGFPNAGKSTTINNIIGNKKVKVSKTPGKTKHLQSLFVDRDIIIFDTPGIVFPTKKIFIPHLLLLGVLNINAYELQSSSIQIINLVGVDNLCRHYKFNSFINDSRYDSATNLMVQLSDFLNIDKGKFLKVILSDFMEGKIQVSSPSMDGNPRSYAWYTQ